MKKNSTKDPTIVFNSVIDDLDEPLVLDGKTKGYKFLNIIVEFGRKAIVINWAAQGMGFGQVSYYFNKKNQVVRDAEGLDDKFCNTLLKEIEKRQNDELKAKTKGLSIDGSYAYSLLNHLNQIAIRE